WRVSQAPLMQNIVIPLIKCLDREIAEHNRSFADIDEDYDISGYQIYYPALIVKGPLFEYYLPGDGGAAQVNPVQHIVVARHYQSKSLRGEFAFDVIHESYLGRFLEMVLSETSAFIRRIRRHRQKII